MFFQIFPGSYIWWICVCMDISAKHQWCRHSSQLLSSRWCVHWPRWLLLIRWCLPVLNDFINIILKNDLISVSKCLRQNYLKIARGGFNRLRSAPKPLVFMYDATSFLYFLLLYCFTLPCIKYKCHNKKGNKSNNYLR